MTLHVYDFEQGSDAWHDARRGIVTASVVGQLLTSTGLVAKNDTSRALTESLAAERATGYTEPSYVSSDMERGKRDEPIARDHYSAHVAPVVECGFMVRDDFGFSIGYSPDGLVGDDGLIEVKSRRQRKHYKTVVTNTVPAENMAQIQCGLFVSGRSWCDYLSWSGGMPMWTIRVFPDARWREAIVEAVEVFESSVSKSLERYEAATAGLPETERLTDVLFEEMTY